MGTLDRRQFLERSVTGAAAMGLTMGATAPNFEEARPAPADGVIIDTNVDISCWPFRNLRYSSPQELVPKLQKHRVREAWVGSFEALFHKNVAHVNRRLYEACEEHGQGILQPFGTVNPNIPDWKEELRRCAEDYEMKGIKLHPSHHWYSLDDAEFLNLMEEATELGLIVQIAVDMQDERMQHPKVPIEAVDVSPLPEVMDYFPEARVQLVNVFRHVRGERLQAIVEETDITLGIARLDGTGGLERLIDGTHWWLSQKVPVERLVFGSHVPYFPIENALFKFVESELTDAQTAAIMHENASRVLNQA